MVAYEDRDPLARLQASFTPGIGERVCARVELAVAELAALVDHHGAIAMADPSRDHRTGEQSESLKAEQQLRDAVWHLGTEHPAPDAQRREVRLVAEPFGQPSRVREIGPRVETYDCFLLTLCNPFSPQRETLSGSRAEGLGHCSDWRRQPVRSKLPPSSWEPRRSEQDCLTVGTWGMEIRFGDRT